MSIGIAYTQQFGGSTLYSVNFNEFLDPQLPSTYVEPVNFEYIAGGTSVASPNVVGPRRLWTIGAILTLDDARTLDDLYKAWSNDISRGYNSVVAIIDGTFAATPIESNVIIVQPPTFSMFGPYFRAVQLGLQEV